MTTLLKPLQVRERLLSKDIRSFTVHDFENIFKTTPLKAKYFLENQSRNGLLLRLKRGVYALKTDLPSEGEIANQLYKPSYISFEYALAYWGILPEMPYAVTSATTKPTREFVFNNKAFLYFTIKPEAYSGYQLLSTNRQVSQKGKNTYFSGTDNDTGSAVFLLAEPEKALVDYLYFVSLGKKLPNDRLFVGPGSLNKTKLKAYIRLYDRKKLTELVKEYL